MDEDEVRATLAKLRQDREALKPQLESIRAKDGALSLSIDGFEALLATMTGTKPPSNLVAADPPPVIPRGAEAIRLVLADTGREMTTKDIVDELVVRGWTPRSNNPENATSSNASRAVEVMSGVKRRKTDSGVFLYRFEPDENTDTSEAFQQMLNAEDPA